MAYGNIEINGGLATFPCILLVGMMLVPDNHAHERGKPCFVIHVPPIGWDDACS